jgi:LytS/YehU family sensor histidine kinase
VRTWLFGAPAYFLPSTLAMHFLVYWAIVFLTIGAAYYRTSRARELQASQLEVRLREAQLELLRARLQPHFLFNSLNTIAELIHEDPERADRMLAGLSQLLRASLEIEHRPAVPLSEELALTRLFLDIHAERFGDRLRVEVAAPDDCGNLRVPHFVLQPIVENAIVHGIAANAGGGAIRVTAARQPGHLELVVEDTGQGLRGDREDGTGLAATRARLRAIHGDGATLTIKPRPAGGTRVVITLPVETV